MSGSSGLHCGTACAGLPARSGASAPGSCGAILLPLSRREERIAPRNVTIAVLAFLSGLLKAVYAVYAISSLDTGSPLRLRTRQRRRDPQRVAGLAPRPLAGRRPGRPPARQDGAQLSSRAGGAAVRRHLQEAMPSSAGAFSSSEGSSNRVLSRQESIIPTKFKAGGLLKETMSPPWPWRLRHFVLEETSLKCAAHPDSRRAESCTPHFDTRRHAGTL